MASGFSIAGLVGAGIVVVADGRSAARARTGCAEIAGRAGVPVFARVGIVRPGAPTLWRRARTDGSYASANDPRVLIGLGDATTIARVRVEWPDGHAEEWADVPIDRYTTLKEGAGR